MNNPTQELAAPLHPARVKLSERWYGQLGIRVFGYERLVNWYLGAKWKRASLEAYVNGRSRQALKQRKALIAALRAERDTTNSKAQIPDDACRPEPKGEPRRQNGDLKIAVFIHCFHTGRGGAEKVAGRVAATLSKAGNKVHLYCRSPGEKPQAYDAEGGVEVRYLHERDDEQIRALRAENYDLVVGFAMRGFYLRIAAISDMLGVPFIIQECNNPRFIGLNLLDAHVCRNDDETYWLRQAVCSRAAGVRLTVPHYAKSVEPDIKPFTYAFYNSFPTPTCASDSPKKKFICVGAMKNANKNGLVAIAAFCAFASRNPGWSLHLYGNNKYCGEMDELLSRFPGVEVIDHGVVYDLDQIYGDAYGLLIPSFHEGLPNVVIEAFSYGVPSIGYGDCEGTNQLIKDGQTGYLLDRTIPDALTGAIAQLSDASTRQRLSDNAKKFAAENLQVALWEENWLRLVENAANGLNTQGEEATPPGRTSSKRGTEWRALLETYLHFLHYPDGRIARLERRASGPRA